MKREILCLLMYGQLAHYRHVCIMLRLLAFPMWFKAMMFLSANMAVNCSKCACSSPWLRISRIFWSKHIKNQSQQRSSASLEAIRCVLCPSFLGVALSSALSACSVCVPHLALFAVFLTFFVLSGQGGRIICNCVKARGLRKIDSTLHQAIP
jgi:hypothetical protein